jgi:hypothetical protein
MNDKKPPIAIAIATPGSGKVLRALGDEVTVLLSGEDLRRFRHGAQL